MPARIQRRRIAGWRAPFDTQGRPPVYVGRGTRWGNPWRVQQDTTRTTWHVYDPHTHTWGPGHGTAVEARLEATTGYRRWLDLHPELAAAARAALAGRDLMCWCPPPVDGELDHCHASVLLDVAAGEAP